MSWFEVISNKPTTSCFHFIASLSRLVPRPSGTKCLWNRRSPKEFGIWDLERKRKNLGFGIADLGFKKREGKNLGFGMGGEKERIWDLGLRIWDLGRVKGKNLGLRIWDLLCVLCVSVISV
jgi:hypothetical protein